MTPVGTGGVPGDLRLRAGESPAATQAVTHTGCDHTSHNCTSTTTQADFHYNKDMADPLIIAGREFRSRLIVGTGKYKSFQETARALEASGPFDETKTRALATQNAQTMIEIQVQHARIKSEMMQVLTADQKAKLAQIEAKHEAHMGHMKDHMAPPPEN